MRHVSTRELFYFEFADLMTRIEYKKMTNSLRYASHRQMQFHERLAVEQYILAAIAPKTEYYQGQPAGFVYLGVDPNLAEHLKTFRLKDSSAVSLRKEKEIDNSIHRLISQSLQSYCFDKIGDTVLALRRALEGDDASEKIVSLKEELEELIKTYNSCSQQEIKIDEVIPKELQPALEFLSRSAGKTARSKAHSNKRIA